MTATLVFLPILLGIIFHAIRFARRGRPSPPLPPWRRALPWVLIGLATIAAVIDLARGLPAPPILLFFVLFLLPLSGAGRWPWLVAPIAVSWSIGLAGGIPWVDVGHWQREDRYEMVGSATTGDPRVEVSVRVLGGELRHSILHPLIRYWAAAPENHDSLHIRVADGSQGTTSRYSNLEVAVDGQPAIPAEFDTDIRGGTPVREASATLRTDTGRPGPDGAWDVVGVRLPPLGERAVVSFDIELDLAGGTRRHHVELVLERHSTTDLTFRSFNMR